MSLHKLTAGDGYTYLTRQVAAHDATDRGASGLAEYYDEKGESPGRWWGSGLPGVGLPAGSRVEESQMKHLFGAGRHPCTDELLEHLAWAGTDRAAAERATRLGRPFSRTSGAGEFSVRLAKAYVEHNRAAGRSWSAAIAAAERSRIRTELAEEMFAEKFGRSPADARERHGFIAEASRDRSTTVAGFDLTFTPVKSVSVLWALADQEVASVIAREHAAAVQDTLAWAESNVLFTRRGHNGVRQVATRGLLATVFTHRDSRAGDPNLHTHVAVSNKVQDLGGRWLAVDARPLFKANVTLSEHYNTRLEARLRDALGLRFQADPDRPRAGRVVREVIGVDKALTTLWSSRRTAITTRLGSLTSDFQGAHQRPPTPTEAIALAQQANLETRDAKHSPRSEREQRTQWQREAVAVLGSQRAVRTMVARCLGGPTLGAQDSDAVWRREVALRVVSVLEGGRATWQEWHVRAEVERQVRYADIALNQHQGVVDRLVSDVLSVHSLSVPDADPVHEYPPPPPALGRGNGETVYELHGDRRFTSSRVLDAERSLLKAAGRLDGPAVPAARALAYFERDRDTTMLSFDQRQLVLRLACSPQRVQVALAPAGTGKTTCVTALADLWRAGGGNVLGLAPSAAAAQQLGDALANGTEHLDTAHLGTAQSPGVVGETLAKFVLDASTSGMGARQLDASTLVIIDEAAMAGTVELATAVNCAISVGATVRLLGDDRQLTSVAAGGIVRDLADRYGAVTLTTTHRFVDPIEGESTLAIRDGDPLALGFYADHQRLRVGDLDSCVEQAYEAWRGDLRGGRTSVLLAPTRDLVSALNIRAQAEHRAVREPHHTEGREARLGDGSRVRAGDVVLTRRNDRALRTGPCRWVKNGDRWQVTEVHADGDITVSSTRDNSLVRLPSEYVAGHVELGYATTVHGAQGISVDTAHLVLTGQEDRSLLYVGLTRGRLSNHVYVGVLPGAESGGGEDWHHLVTKPETLRPPTAVEILRGVLAREPEQDSATSLMTPSASPAGLQRQLGLAADRYRDALYVAAEDFLGAEAVAGLDACVVERFPELVESPSWDTLRGQLLLGGVTHQSPPMDLLDAAVAAGDFRGARDMAAVVSARLVGPPVELPGAAGLGPLPWLAGIPQALADDPIWGAYLTRRSSWVSETAAALAQAFDTDVNGAVPMWAWGLSLDRDPGLVGDLAIWRGAEGIADADLSPTAAWTRPGNAGVHQAELGRRVTEATIATSPVSLPEHVMADPEVPQLAARLDQLSRAGVDVADRLEQVNDSEPALPSELGAAALWWRLARILHESPSPSLTSAASFAEPSPRLVEPTEHMEPVDPGPDPRWSASGRTSRDRVAELHQLAADYYRDLMPRSWAQPYLMERLVIASPEDLPVAGYAPPGPTSLMRHLEGLGAEASELVDAGLVKEVARADGRSDLIDCFRDRLVFPIRDPRAPEDIVGFVGRRNPVHDEKERTGPKYLNTRSTVAYAKSDSLFGLDQLRKRTRARAALVEGPLDALAITRATFGAVVGVAALGTALTADQARLITDAAGPGRMVLTVLDGDEAGVKATQANLVLLAEAGVAGVPVRLAAGLDPASTLEQLGPEALTLMLAAAEDQILARATLSPGAASPSSGRRGAGPARSRDR